MKLYDCWLREKYCCLKWHKQKYVNILTDFKNATLRLKLNIFLDKNSIVMNSNALYSSIMVVYPLKISLPSDKLNVFKTSFIEDRSLLFSETIGISRIFCCFHPLQINKMIVFDNFFDILTT